MMTPVSHLEPKSFERVLAVNLARQPAPDPQPRPAAARSTGRARRVRHRRRRRARARLLGRLRRDQGRAGGAGAGLRRRAAADRGARQLFDPGPMATRLRAQAYPGERAGAVPRSRAAGRPRWSSCCCPAARGRGEIVRRLSRRVGVLAVPDVEADRHAGEVERLAQARPRGSAGSCPAARSAGLLANRMKVGGRAVRLGRVADLHPAALRQRGRVLLERRRPASGSGRRSAPGCPSARAPPTTAGSSLSTSRPVSAESGTQGTPRTSASWRRQRVADLGHGGVRVGDQVPLVEHDHQRPAFLHHQPGDGQVLALQRHGGVDDQRHHLGELQRVQGGRGRELLQLGRDLGLAAQPGRVDQLDLAALLVQPQGDAVAGQAGLRAGQQPVLRRSAG